MHRASALVCAVVAIASIALLRAQSLAPPASNANSSSAGIWMDRAVIADLPMAGAGWNGVSHETSRDCGTPDLSNQDDSSNICVMAKALAFARTGSVRLGLDVRAALRAITNAPPYRGRALSLGRELAAYVIAADIVGLRTLDPQLDAAFRVKIKQLLTTPTTDGPRNLIECHEKRPNNWGTHCGASRAAVASYLGDRTELARVAQVFKGYLGDRSSYAGFKFGDLAWQCDPAHPVAVNPKGCIVDGHSLDGVLPDDQRRSGALRWPPPHENYVYEGLQGALVQAVILQRAGYDPFEWSDRALLRAVRWLYETAHFEAVGDDTWIPYVVNYFYGTDFAAPEDARAGKNVGWTNWTHHAASPRVAHSKVKVEK
jgi:hypothetical protein